jgi:putative transposase
VTPTTLELTEANLSRAVQWLNVSYSVWFTRRQGRSGHLSQGRFKSLAVSRDEWALALSRYVHLNPVRIKARVKQVLELLNCEM